MKPITLQIVEQDERYKCSVLEAPGQWGYGRSPQAAIGDLVMSFPETFGVIMRESHLEHVKGHIAGVPQGSWNDESFWGMNHSG